MSKAKKRFIDANDLKKAIDHTGVDMLESADYFGFTYKKIMRVIDDAPTVDAVLVARCCDCNNRNDEEKCPMCHIEYKPMIDYKTYDNGFCHKWERRKNDEHIHL